MPNLRSGQTKSLTNSFGFLTRIPTKQMDQKDMHSDSLVHILYVDG